MSKKVSILDYEGSLSTDNILQVVKLGSNETPIIPFTAEGVEVDLHYYDEPEVNTYAPCNGHNCVSCKIGKKRDSRILIPVYLPTSGEIGILPVGKSFRPYALLPQIKNVLKADKPMGMFISREGSKYKVSTFELAQDIDTGEAEIRRFMEEYEAGKISLSSVYPTITNEELADVEGIAKMMKLKGISL